MKKIILAAAIALASTSAFAGATLGFKGGTQSNGTAEGVNASQVTGNGDWVGGNGTSGNDQTTSPASRPAAMGGDFPGQGNHGSNANGVGNMGSHR